MFMSIKVKIVGAILRDLRGFVMTACFLLICTFQCHGELSSELIPNRIRQLKMSSFCIAQSLCPVNKVIQSN